MKLKFTAVILALICALMSLSALAEEADADTPPEISADYACVYNVESGKMLFEKSADTIIYPGSLVKIMTSVLALEYYEKTGNITVTVTESALDSLMGNNTRLKPDEEMPLYDLIAAVAVGGANDAALVLAETVAGSVDKFVDMMNEKAYALGALNTQFANPTGYHSPRMYSTLTDLALICEWANKNTEFMKLSSVVEYTAPETNLSKERTFTNSNLLLDPKHWLRHYKEGTSGMNVGMTYEAGYTLATAYNNDGQTNIVIIVGGKAEDWDYYYFNDVSTLIDMTSVSHEYRKLVSRDEPVYDIRVLYGKDTDHVLLATKNEVTAFLPVDALESDITHDYTVVGDTVTAPVKKGDALGEYNVYYQGELVATVPLVTLANVKRDLFSFISGKISDFFKIEIVKSTVWLLFAIVLFILSITATMAYNRKLRRIREERRRRLQQLKNARLKNRST